MTPRALAILLAAYAALLAMACVVVHRAVALRAPDGSVTIASAWKDGELVARAVAPGDDAPRAAEGGTLVLEKIVGEAPILAEPELAFAMSLVPGRDGVSAALDGRVAYVTPDELLARQAYDQGVSFPELSLAIGVRTDIVMSLLSERLGASVPEIRRRARLRRIRVERTVVSSSAPSPSAAVRPEALTREVIRDAALAAARYLARGVSLEGRFRYTVDAPTNRDVGGYEWARHAGATYFLAQAAALSNEPELAIAAVRAASLMRDNALVACGDHRCLTGEPVEIGSSALALVAFDEIDRDGLDASFRPAIAELARFLRSQQRPDGEMMHVYDRAARRPVDVQSLYYTGEAALALARAHRTTGDAADVEAASRALSYLVGPAWSFFGSRYYFGEEHWTCQVVDELWDRAPNPAALDFCLRWNAYGRALQFAAGETPFDAEGAYGVASFVTPRLTPVASRCEAAVATRHALARSNRADRDRELHALDAQLRRSLALLVRQQLRPGPGHLFVEPSAITGAMPGSEVDWRLRIDYAQHAGSAMIRWLDTGAK